MSPSNRTFEFYYLSFIRHDFKASITVFFVALPLCLGISLASGAPVYSGLIAGIIGGLIISIISKSQLSVSGPAAGLTAISAAAIASSGSIQIFFLSVALAGLFQIALGVFRLGGFTHFIPSAVIKGMLTGIGIILISKQIPLLIGYDKPDFWSGELFSILTFHHSFQHVTDLYYHTSSAVIIIGVLSFIIMIAWERLMPGRMAFLPSSFAAVLFAVLASLFFQNVIQEFPLRPTQFVTVPADFFGGMKLPRFDGLFANTEVWKNAIVICFVATLETLLSVEAVDKLDPFNRITPQNRELIAQGTGNFLSGMLGGVPITAVIVRSSANAEAGAKTKLSSFMHGVWLLLVILFAVPLIHLVPYCVLAVILIRTGYNLAKPKMIRAVYNRGREQFLPYIVTVVSIVFTNLLIGVLIGIGYAIYFLIKHTYRAGFVMKETLEGHKKNFIIELALNVSFLNKKRFIDMLDAIPAGSMLEIIGTKSVYIDDDILEIFHDFHSKALEKNIQLRLTDIPDVETIELH